MKIVITLCVLAAFILSTTVWAGTYRDDFENEKDFIKDKQDRVWDEDIAFFTWENASIKGMDNGPVLWGIITGDYSWKDYTVECRIKPIQNNGYMGLYLRRPCMGCNPCYTFALSVNKAVIYRDFGEKWGGLTLDSSPFEAKIDTWYSVKAIVQGKQLEFYIDNKLVAKAENDVYLTGKAGFIIDDGEALFDDFVMTGPEVKDGGHWDPKAHIQPNPVEPQNKLEMTWGEIKCGK